MIALSIEFCFCLCRGAGRKEGSLIYEDEGNVRNVCAPPCCLRDDSIARGAEFSAQCICGGQCKAVASSLHGGKRCCGTGRCKRAGILNECAGQLFAGKKRRKAGDSFGDALGCSACAVRRGQRVRELGDREPLRQWRGENRCLADGTSYLVKEDTANLSSVYARELYYFGN